VRQHLAALESDGLTATGGTRPSGGRPQQLYVLTDKGKEVFPRRYAWFAQLVIEAIKREHGTDGLSGRLKDIGAAVGTQLREQSPGLSSREQKVEKLAGLMDGLGYNARRAPGNAPAIEADNCVFHELAAKNPEICQFDLALMTAFTDSKIDHQECMARGGNLCRFKFIAKK
jgi:predicted ArsR family transcriptional regulator